MRMVFCASAETTARSSKRKRNIFTRNESGRNLENRVHTEIEWLRRGPKARTTKSKARIDTANEMIGELADLNARTRTSTARIDFSATDRQTKRLIGLEDLTYTIANRTLFEGLNFAVTSGMRVGLVGPNGSGKTTLLRLLRGDIRPRAARSARPTPCGSCTSIRIASSIPTSACAARWRPIATP